MDLQDRYCAFVDVLGYGNIVKNNTLSIPDKIKMLESIYSSLATQFLYTIGPINEFYVDKIYIRSFSDCFYLDCASLEPLLIAVKGIYENAFGFYSSFNPAQETTPLLRCGIVKDWLIKFKDIGGMMNGTDELNPVGLAVARAYHTSEKTELSGMRIIISPEVIEDLKVLHLTIPGFECYIKDIRTYAVDIRYYFKHLTKNQKGEPTNLYEMLWPFNQVNDLAYECIDILQKLKPTFPPKELRHFQQTVELFIDSHSLSEWKTKDINIFNRDQKGLHDLI